MRAAWLTDLHLDHARPDARARLIDDLRARAPDCLLVCGDTAEAPSVFAALDALAADVGAPLYYVLGNHDFYKGSVGQVRAAARAASAASAASATSAARARWLPHTGPVPLADGVALVGHDGWGDARAPDFMTSQVWLHDYLQISDLVAPSKAALADRLRRLGDDAAATLEPHLRDALRGGAQHVIVLTHVPPFVGACWHMGKPSDPNWAPHFTCVAVGQMLLRVAADHPRQTVTVLCGHTHSPGWLRAAPNLEVWTGEAHYGAPQIQRVVTVDASPAPWLAAGRVPVIMPSPRPRPR